MDKIEKTPHSASNGNKRGSSKTGASRASTKAKGANKSDEKSEDKTIDTTDAFEFLKAQHREVKELFTEFQDTEEDSAASDLARVICQKLTVHATIEEEIFYPAARGKEQLKDNVLEALEEHHSVKRLIADIEETEAGDETLSAKVTVLEEQVTHHVKEEETEFFPLAKKAFSKEELRAIGQQLQERFDALDDGAPFESEANEDDAQSRGEDAPRGSHSSMHARH